MRSMLMGSIGAGLLLGVSLPAMAADAPAAATPATVQPIAYTSRTLPNGLRVFAIRDTTTTNVSVNVWYDVGSKDDPAGRSGFAHMFEHLMFKSTRNMPAETMDRLTEDVGGFNNASTADDYTNYYEVVPANHLRRLLWAEAERMGSLVVDEASFKSEREVVKEELRLRVLAQPYGRLFGLYYPMSAYGVHPYARPGIGSIEDLDAATVDDIRAFHATYYRPDNAVLVVAGNFDPADLDKWVDDYFGPLKNPAFAVPRVTAREPARTAAKAVTVHAPNVPLPAVLISWLVPPDREKDSAALTVLDSILSGGESSRVYEALVRQGLAAQAATDLDTKQGTGTFAAFAIMASGKTVDQGEAALLTQIAALRDAPPSAAEVEKAKNVILTSQIRQRETAAGKAGAIAAAVIVDGDAKAADRQLEEIAAVTPADVQRVAKAYLTDRSRSVVRYLPAEAGAAPESFGVASTVKVAPLPVPPGVEVVTAAAEAERIRPPAPAEPLPARVPVPVERTLPNGLKLVVMEKHDVPIVSAQLLVGGGSATDPAARSGLAAITADLLTKGTRTRSATQVADGIEALGGSIGAGASWAGSTLGLTVKSDVLEPAMAIFADSALNPAFSQEELDRQRALTLDGLSVALKQPDQLGKLVAARAVFGGSAYGHPAGGTPAALKAVTRADVAGTYTARFRPDAATLILVGDISVDRAEALARKLFGSWKAPATPIPPLPAAATPQPPRTIVVDLPDAGQAAVLVARQGIARKDARYYAAQVTNSVLGTGYSSRLNWEIRVKRGLSYGAGSSVGARRTVGPIVATAQTKNASAPEVADLIVAEMRKLGQEPVAVAELDTRKAVLTGGFGRTIETTSGLAGEIGSLVSQGVPLDALGRFVSSVEAVTPEAVKETGAALLDPAGASIVIVGDARQFLPALEAKGVKAEVIPAAGLNLDSATLK